MRDLKTPTRKPRRNSRRALFGAASQELTGRGSLASTECRMMAAIMGFFFGLAIPCGTFFLFASRLWDFFRISMAHSDPLESRNPLPNPFPDLLFTA